MEGRTNITPLIDYLAEICVKFMKPILHQFYDSFTMTK